jgi:hypothetical protein
VRGFGPGDGKSIAAAYHEEAIPAGTATAYNDGNGMCLGGLWSGWTIHFRGFSTMDVLRVLDGIKS